MPLDRTKPKTPTQFREMGVHLPEGRLNVYIKTNAGLVTIDNFTTPVCMHPKLAEDVSDLLEVKPTVANNNACFEGHQFEQKVRQKFEIDTTYAQMKRLAQNIRDGNVDLDAL